MRITNNMMLRSTTTNINGNKVNVNKLNNQMSSQKKISRPSENPVIAIRALRLRSNLSEINQYYENNIPDADAWLDVTETALNNMKDILTDVRTQCVYGATDSLEYEDRKTILTALQSLREQLYSEGNSDYAGRTVFTGYRTNEKLTFMTNEDDTEYAITQNFDYTDIEEHRYYSGQVVLGTAEEMIADTSAASEATRIEYDRIRLAYGGISETPALTYTDGEVDADGALVQKSPTTTYATMEEWQSAGSVCGDDETVFICETGELILGKNVSENLKKNKAEITFDYQKKGFEKGEVRPEYYFNCTDITATNAEPIVYQKYDENGKEIEQNINYIIAFSQTLTVNTAASDVFDASMGRDVDEMISAMQASIDAHDKVDKITEMMSRAEFSDEDSQAKLQVWKDAAQREVDYADDNIQKLYNTYLGKFDGYLQDVNLAITVVGSKGDRLELTETRMSNQQLTVETLKSANEDRELSDIIIDYTAAYNAYQASLQAASKINQNTLLNYI